MAYPYLLELLFIIFTYPFLVIENTRSAENFINNVSKAAILCIFLFQSEHCIEYKNGIRASIGTSFEINAQQLTENPANLPMKSKKIQSHISAIKKIWLFPFPMFLLRLKN